MSTLSISPDTIDRNSSGDLIHHGGISSHLDHIQNRARQWQPSLASGPNTQDMPLESDENLKLSKQLLDRMPDMYY
jgi:hypothetical protein